MPSEDHKMLEFSNYKKSDKEPLLLMQILEKVDGYKNNSENSFTTKVGEHISSGFSMSTVSPFKSIKNKHDVHRNKDCMKIFFESLREHAMEIITFKLKDEIINKRTVEIIWKCKNLFYL